MAGEMLRICAKSMGDQLIDIKGQKFNRWTVLEFGHNDGQKSFWKCRCDCGSIRFVWSYPLRAGTTKSCGCFRRILGNQPGTTHGMTGTPAFRSWCQMISRCYHPSATSYKNYGGKGITVCDRWRSFDKFFDDMGPRPPGKSLDRFPNYNGNYEPGNCRWATAKEQNQNQRKNVKITIDGVTKVLSEWARYFKISRNTVVNRILKGIDPAKAFYAPDLRYSQRYPGDLL